jgi:hypothetical protein
MTAVFCENAADRNARTWEEQLVPFDRLEFAISDAAGGIAKAVSELAQGRHADPGAPTLEHGLDVFHTTMEARRVLAMRWRKAEAAWEKAEAIDLEVARLKQQGLDARGTARAAWHAWNRATASFEAGRAMGSGLAASPGRAGPVRGRRSAHRPLACRVRDRRGLEGLDRRRLVEGP